MLKSYIALFFVVFTAFLFVFQYLDEQNEEKDSDNEKEN